MDALRLSVQVTDRKGRIFIRLPALLWDANMTPHGETKGRRENACAPERPCAVFLLARIRHWNRDRGCEPAQLVERPSFDVPPDSLQILQPCVRYHTKAISRIVKLAPAQG